MSSSFPTSGNGAGASFNQQVDRMSDTAHRVVDDLASKAAPVAERAREKMTHAMDVMHRSMDDMAVTRDEWMETARQSVREHPLTMIGGAIAVGYLLARLTRHS